MDHIPGAEGSACQSIGVPNFCSEPYDGLGFADYPFRKGWTTTSRGRLRLEQRSRNDQAAFLQTWLFFGMLEEVIGFRVDVQDFVEGGYITTSRLQNYIRRWYDNLREMSEAERKASFQRMQGCLKEARSHCMIDLDEMKDDCPLTPEVRLSIRILGESLSNAQFYIWQSVTGESLHGNDDCRGKWGLSKLLCETMLRQNWCPSEVSFLQYYPPAASNSGMHYAMSLLCLESNLHQKCSEQVCAFSQIDERSYKPKHCTVGSSVCDGNCSPIDLELSLDEIMSILHGGGLPLLRVSLSSSPKTITCSVIHYVEGLEYVAISHVWSDGLGNPRRNALSSCQLTFLAQSIGAIQNSDRQNSVARFRTLPENLEVVLWLDTLCVPVDERHRIFRDLALNRMYLTYRNSAMVLVLDSDLYQRRISSTLESTIVTLCSAWTRRLWTLQEGILGVGRLLVLFKDGSFDLWKGVNELEKEQKAAPWTSHPLLSFACRTSLWRVEQSKGVNRISWLSRDFKWRSTTKFNDEALIFANLTGLDTQPLLRWPDAENRMKTAISMTPKLPRRIIFAPGPRFIEEGYRWAVTSFLSPSTFTLGSGKDEEEAVVGPSPGGSSLTLTFKLPGFILSGALQSSSPLKRFFLFDTEHNRWMRVEKPRRFAMIGAAPEHEEAQPLNNPDERPAALIVHHEPRGTRHTFGALVLLDQLDVREQRHDILSGPHEGVFDIFITHDEIPSDHADVPVLSTAYTVIDQTWVLR
jgi:hypothetical protein